MIYECAECMHDTQTVLYDFSMEWNGMAFCMDASRYIEIVHTHFVGRQHGVYLGSPVGLEMDGNGKSPLDSNCFLG